MSRSDDRLSENRNDRKVVIRIGKKGFEKRQLLLESKSMRDTEPKLCPIHTIMIKGQDNKDEKERENEKMRKAEEEKRRKLKGSN